MIISTKLMIRNIVGDLISLYSREFTSELKSGRILIDLIDSSGTFDVSVNNNIIVSVRGSVLLMFVSMKNSLNNSEIEIDTGLDVCRLFVQDDNVYVFLDKYFEVNNNLPDYHTGIDDFYINNGITSINGKTKIEKKINFQKEGFMDSLNTCINGIFNVLEESVLNQEVLISDRKKIRKILDSIRSGIESN